MSALALGAPAFTGLDPAYLTAAGARPLDVVIVAMIVLLAPPVALIAVELVLGAIRLGLDERVHTLFLGLLATTLFVYGLRRLGLGGGAAAIGGLLLGALAAVAYRRHELARALPLALAPAPLVFALWFLFVSPSSDLVTQADGDYRLEDVRSSVPVVLIVMDELATVALLDEHGRLDRRRYPGFARLAAGSTWYRDATTVHAETRWAVPAIFTGRRAPEPSLAVTADHPRSIFTLLAKHARLNVSESYTRVCPQDLCPREDRESRASRVGEVMRSLVLLTGQQVLPGALARHLPEITQFQQFDADDQVGDFLAGVPEGGRGASLNVLHVLQPHGPWDRSMNGEAYEHDLPANLDPTDFDVLSEDPWWSVQLRQRYLSQVQYADGLLTRLIGGLRRKGIWDEAAVVLVADHGLSTIPGDRMRDPTERNAHDILPVPLFVKTPGQRAARVSRAPARTIDVLPTIAALAGFRLPYEVEGTPVTRLTPGRRATVSAEGVRVSGVEVPVAELRARVLRAARRNARTWGQGDPGPIMRVGPRPDLIGRRVDTDLLPRAEGMHAELDGGQGTIRVSGRVSGVDEGEAVPLAVVVDGRVAGTTLTYTRGPGGAFTALLPRAGKVELVLIAPGGLRALGP